MIKVTADAQRRLVRADMCGLLTVDDVELFAAKFRASAASIKLGAGEVSLLVNAHGNTVQRQEVMVRFQELVARPQVRARRIAVVRNGALGRLQAKRVASHSSNIEVFSSLSEAERWLEAANGQ